MQEIKVKPKFNKKVWCKTVCQLKQKPRSFYWREFLISPKEEELHFTPECYFKDQKDELQHYDICGTLACVCGHICLNASGKDFLPRGYCQESFGIKALGLDSFSQHKDYRQMELDLVESVFFGYRDKNHEIVFKDSTEESQAALAKMNEWYNRWKHVLEPEE